MSAPPVVPELRLVRVTRSLFGQSVFGVIVNTFGEPWFLTVENHDLRIPAGDYRIGFETSPRFGPNCLTVFDVPGRTGIRFHAANEGSELEGCIAPGLSFYIRKRAGVSQSRVALKRLRARVYAMQASERFMRIIDLPE